MKGIILAGGNGSRLYPITKGISKQLLPIYDKPMIYYPLSVLMMSKIREILIISSRDYILFYKKLLGDGSDLGIKLNYEIQTEPRGIVDAFILGEDFIGKSNICLVLGDNIFYGHSLATELINASSIEEGAIIFGYHVSNPKEYAVLEFNKEHRVVSIEEKPLIPKSHCIVPGLYYYDNSVIERAKLITPSLRGELEITDLNRSYLNDNKLSIHPLKRGITWLDIGSYEGLLKATNFIAITQKMTGLCIGCIEEIAFQNKWIDKNQLETLGRKYEMTEYGKYILAIANDANNIAR